MKGELADECDYTREASYLTRFRSPALLGNDSRFKVPWVWEGSTDNVLVMERVDGVSVGEAVVGGLSQRDRDDVSSSSTLITNPD
jgi:aarF domain-containing kinase